MFKQPFMIIYLCKCLIEPPGCPRYRDWDRSAADPEFGISKTSACFFHSASTEKLFG